MAVVVGREADAHGYVCGRLYAWMLRHPVLCSVLVCVACYTNSLSAGFVYDDRRAIVSNENLRSTTAWSRLMTTDFWGTPLDHSGSHGSFRPLTTASFRLELLATGGILQPVLHHAVNVLAHVAVVTLLCHVTSAVEVNNNEEAVLWTGLQFAVHPVHAEAVTSLVGRAELLAAIFMLTGVALYRRHLQTASVAQNNSDVWLAGCVVCCVLATLSKETGITTLLVCLAYDLLIEGHILRWRYIWASYGKDKRVSRLLRNWSVLCISTAVIIWVRITMITPPSSVWFSRSDNPLAAHPSRLCRALSLLYLPMVALQLLLFPAQLSYDWSERAVPLVSGLQDGRIVGLASVLFLVAVAVLVVLWMRAGCSSSRRKITRQNYNEHCRMQPIATSANAINNNKPIYHSRNNKSILQQSGQHQSPRTTTTTHHDSNNNNNSNSKLTQHDDVTASGRTAQYNHILSSMRVPLFGVALMVITYLPASNIAISVGFLLAERCLYLPSLGWCMLLASGVAQLRQNQHWQNRGGVRPGQQGKGQWPHGRSCASQQTKDLCMLPGDKSKQCWRRWLRFCVDAGCVVMLLSLSARTITRNLDWSSEMNLYSAGVPYSPAKSLSNLAVLLSELGDTAKAERALRAALSYSPNSADTHHNLGNLLYSRGKFVESEQSYKVAIAHRQYFAQAHLGVSRALLAQGRWQEAGRWLRACLLLVGARVRDATAHSSAQRTCLIELGTLTAEHEKNTSAARILYQQALHYWPSHRHQPAEIYALIGQTYARESRYTEAEAWLLRSLQYEVKPAASSLHISVANTIANNRTRADEAEQWYIKATRMSPQNSAAFLHYAQFLHRGGRLHEARAMYARAARLPPTSWRALFNLADTCRQLGDLACAQHNYKLAVQVRPDDVVSVRNYASILHLTGRLAEAESLYLRALSLSPDDQMTRDNLLKLRRSSSQPRHNRRT